MELCARDGNLTNCQTQIFSLKGFQGRAKTNLATDFVVELLLKTQLPTKTKSTKLKRFFFFRKRLLLVFFVRLTYPFRSHGSKGLLFSRSVRMYNKGGTKASVKPWMNTCRRTCVTARVKSWREKAQELHVQQRDSNPPLLLLYKFRITQYTFL